MVARAGERLPRQQGSPSRLRPNPKAEAQDTVFTGFFRTKVTKCNSVDQERVGHPAWWGPT